MFFLQKTSLCSAHCPSEAESDKKGGFKKRYPFFRINGYIAEKHIIFLVLEKTSPKLVLNDLLFETISGCGCENLKNVTDQIRSESASKNRSIFRRKKSLMRGVDGWSPLFWTFYFLQKACFF